MLHQVFYRYLWSPLHRSPGLFSTLFANVVAVFTLAYKTYLAGIVVITIPMAFVAAFTLAVSIYGHAAAFRTAGK